jgi:hypothetical protein
MKKSELDLVCQLWRWDWNFAVGYGEFSIIIWIISQDLEEFGMGREGNFLQQAQESSATRQYEIKVRFIIKYLRFRF